MRAPVVAALLLAAAVCSLADADDVTEEYPAAGEALLPASGDFLYFSSPGETDRYNQMTRPAGLYGGRLSAPLLGLDLHQNGFHCGEGPDPGLAGEVGEEQAAPLLDQLHIEALSFDRITHDILVKVKGVSALGSVTVLRGPLCAGVHSCTNNSLTPVFWGAMPAPAHRLSAFALHDGEVYFVLTKDTNINRKTSRRTLELRRLSTGACESERPWDPHSAAMFDADRCSDLIVTITAENYAGVVPLEPPTTMTIDPGRAPGHLTFFLQLFHAHRDEETRMIISSIELVQISLPSLRITSVHRSPTDAHFLRFSYNYAGAIDVRGQKICWSAVDTVYCGRWSDDKVSGITRVLAKGTANQVCSVTDDDEKLAEVVSGVAIAAAEDGTVGEDAPLYRLYIGCVGQLPSNGGAALLTFDKDGYSYLHQIKTSGGAGSGTELVFADHVFLTDACKHGHGAARSTPRAGDVSSPAAKLTPQYCSVTIVLLWICRLLT